MLGGLDGVDWAALEHAYGPATDVPDMLRALASTDARARHAAIHDAYGNIFHQGTRYAATPHAIPFLIELAARPDAGDRAEILRLVVHCVAGYFGPTSGPSLDEACELAAEPAVPLALDLLRAEDASLRVAALHLLAALGRFAARHEVVPKLRERLSREKDAPARAMLAFALTHLVPKGDGAVAALFRDERDELARLLAAMGCARRGEATRAMGAALVGWLGDEELAERYLALPFGADSLAGDVASLLADVGPDVLRDATPRLLRGLADTDDFGAVGLLQAALAATFGDAKAPEAASELTPPQRELLVTLAKNQAFWSIGNALSVLMQRGLPSSREAMAKHLGIAVEDDPREAARIGARAYESFGAGRALRAWREMLEKFPDDREALFRAGSLLSEAGDDDEALPLLKRAVELGAHEGLPYGQALFAYGLSLYRSERLDEAFDAFTRAEPHLSGSAADVARQNRVAILQELDRPSEALGLLSDRQPEDADGLYHLGLAQVKAGRYEACVATIERAIALRPEHASSHYTIACAHALLGRADDALDAIHSALDLDPDLAADVAEDPDFASLQGDPRFRALVVLD